MDFFSKMMNKLKPTTWKSESHLTNQNKQAIARNDPTQEKTIATLPLSKSTDWTDATLEVPEEKIHLKNPQLTLIFDNSEKSTPTPPPRKHHKKNFREKIESVAKSGFQALQSDKKNKNEEAKTEKFPKEVEEPIFVKKQMNYKCPICDSDEVNHNRDHHHHKTNKKIEKGARKEAHLDDIVNLIIPNGDPRLQDTTTNKKNKKNDNKNGSVTSLPNYNELKLSLAKSDSSEDKNSSKSGSRLSLQSNQSKKLNSAKLDSYLGRVRSFGSLIPQKLNKVKPQKPQKEDKPDHHIESDDSFGPLEDWDLGLIEHYNPKEASLPRPRKKAQKSSKEVLSGIEGLVVHEEEIPRPQNLRNSAPVPKKETAMYKNLPQVTKIQEKLSQTGVQVPKAVPEDVCLTPPPSPKSSTLKNDIKLEEIPLSSSKPEEIGHSNLLRILKELSPKPSSKEQIQDGGSNMSSLTPSLVEFEKNLNVVSVEDFINAEKVHTDKNVGHF